KDVYSVRQGPLPPMVIREPEFGKFQPLPEVSGKGKDKVGKEQATQVLLNLQTPKKKYPAERYIFQRRTPTPTEHSGHEESSSLCAKLGLSDSDIESDKEMPPVVTSGAQDEGQAGPNRSIQDEGQVRPNPGDDAAPQPQSTPVVHVGPNLEHTDVEATDASYRPHPEQMDEGFISTAYPKVQENLKLTIEEPVILEEPASSTGTLSSLQHLAKDFSFGDQFFNDKPSEADNEKTTADTEAESMVSVTIHQDTSIIPLMTSPVIDVTSRPNSPNIHRPLPTTATVTATSTMTTTTHPLLPQPQQSSTDSILIKRIDAKKKKKNKIHQKNSWVSTSSASSPPPPPTVLLVASGILVLLDLSSCHLFLHFPSTKSGCYVFQARCPSSSKTAASVEYTAWMTTDIRIKPSVLSTPEELHMDDDTTVDEQSYSSGDEDIGRDHIPMVNLRQSWWKPLTEDRLATPEPAWFIPSSDLTVPKNNWASSLTSTYAPPPENSLLAQTGDMTTFMDWYCKRQGITKLTQKDLEGPAYEIVKVFHPNVIHLRFTNGKYAKNFHPIKWLMQSSGTMYSINRYGRRLETCYSFSKMKAAYYPDVGLEQMVPDQMWIEEECKYDIAAEYWDKLWGSDDHAVYNEIHSSVTAILQQIRGSIDYQEILLKMNLPDHSLRNSDEYYHDPEKYEHASPKVTTSHGGNTATGMI
ncbi:hypothetical protein Tco_1053014, partial [Tanacetum coccineum]